MATNTDAAIRAAALAASLRRVGETAPIHMLAPRALEIPHGFDHVHRFDAEPFTGDLRYLNKLVHPLNRSPFNRTLFLDDDVIAIQPITPVVDEHFAGLPLAINCQTHEASDDVTGTNLVHPPSVAREFNRETVLNVNGGGHMYFERSDEAHGIAQRAIDAATDRDRYERLAGQTIVSDEVALAIVANEERLPWPTLPDFVDAVNFDQGNSLDLDAITGDYEWPGRPWGDTINNVRLVHFCTRGKRALPYRKAIHDLTGQRQTFDRGITGAARRARLRISRLS